MSCIVCLSSAEVTFFHLKAQYPVFHFLGLDGTISSMIQPKINKKTSKFSLFLKFLNDYYRQEFIIVVLFKVPFYHFLFSRYLDLTERYFSSDILVPFPDSSDLYSRVAWTTASDPRQILKMKMFLLGYFVDFT